MNTVASFNETRVTWRDIKLSGGPIAEPGDQLYVLYKVALSEDELDRGQSIESTYSPDRFIEVTYSQEALLPGVFAGLQGMRAGGAVRRIFIPASLGFGARGTDRVPPGASLVVDLCLARVSKRTPPS